MAVPEISVLVVGYKSRHLIEACLSGLFEHTRGVAFEVLFLDNSDDGGAEFVATAFPQVRTLGHQDNLGFARGNNVLARHAVGGFLLLLNPDTIIHDNAVGQLLATARTRPDAGAWGGVTVLPDGGIDPGCRQRGPQLLRTIAHAAGLGRHVTQRLSTDSERPSEVEVLTGAFMMLRRDLWEELGGFDETFFMYGEDYDLCYRVRRRGRPLLITPQARITHLVGSGSAKNPARVLFMVRASMHFYRKHFSRGYVVTVGALTWLHAATRVFGGLVAWPVIGRARAASLRAAYLPVLRRPGGWWLGFNSAAGERDRAGAMLGSVSPG